MKKIKVLKIIKVIYKDKDNKKIVAIIKNGNKILKAVLIRNDKNGVYIDQFGNLFQM